MTQKIYYRIGEVAKRFGVKSSLIRYWEQEFEFIKPHITAKGHRYYNQKDIDRFQIVYHLIKEKGMTIQGTKAYFKKYHSDSAGEKLAVINTLKKTKSLLLNVQETLKQALEETDEKDWL